MNAEAWLIDSFGEHEERPPLTTSSRESMQTSASIPFAQTIKKEEYDNG